MNLILEYWPVFLVLSGALIAAIEWASLQSRNKNTPLLPILYLGLFLISAIFFLIEIQQNESLFKENISLKNSLNEKITSFESAKKKLQTTETELQTTQKELREATARTELLLSSASEKKHEIKEQLQKGHQAQAELALLQEKFNSQSYEALQTQNLGIQSELEEAKKKILELEEALIEAQKLPPRAEPVLPDSEEGL